MIRLTALLAVLATLAACDSGEVETEPAVPTGTFTALLNGEPFEAPAVYEVLPDRAILGLAATQADAEGYSVRQLSFSYARAGLAEGDVLPAERFDPETGGTDGVAFFELLGDQMVQSWGPTEETEGLRVVEVNSAAGLLRATFEGVLVARGPFNDPYQELPDTLRFERGEFVIDLTGGGS
jgi:hypothetical protein